LLEPMRDVARPLEQGGDAIRLVRIVFQESDSHMSEHLNRRLNRAHPGTGYCGAAARGYCKNVSTGWERGVRQVGVRLVLELLGRGAARGRGGPCGPRPCGPRPFDTILQSGDCAARILRARLRTPY
jgi:hypothetical protein